MKPRSLTSRLLPTQLGFINYLLSAALVTIVLFFLLSARLSAPAHWLLRILMLIYSLFTLNLTIQVFNTLGSRWRSLRAFLNILLLIMFSLLYLYHFHVKTTADFATIAENIEEALNPNSIVTVVDSIGFHSFALIALLILAAILLERKTGLFSGQPQPPPLAPKLILSLVLFMVVILLPLENYDDLSIFFKSIKNHYFFKEPRIGFSADTYPIMQPEVPIHDKEGYLLNRDYPRRPHIFLLLIESFNHYFVNCRGKDGTEYTPYFNRLSARGIYPLHFYGNSIQTCKGQFAILHSLIPCVKGKAFRDYAHVTFHPLPSILNEHGYDTIFCQAARDTRFDNTRGFLSRNGFSQVLSAYQLIGDKDPANQWGWGLEDRDFYRYFFRYLDRYIRTSQPRPLFVTLSTIMNHMRFNKVPPEKRFLYAHPETPRQFYANSIHLVDRQLEFFIQAIRDRRYLRDSLIIITGDHGFPVDRHQIFYNEAGYYEEFFKTPFLMLWPGVLQPRTLTEAAYSQMDIAPTILDLLEIGDTPHHCLGTSLFAPVRDREVYLVQPYDGIYLSIIRYPLKYVWHQRTRREYLFHLEKDPLERQNRSGDSLAPLTDFRRKLKRFYLIQELLNRDRIFQNPGTRSTARSSSTFNSP